MLAMSKPSTRHSPRGYSNLISIIGMITPSKVLEIVNSLMAEPIELDESTALVGSHASFDSMLLVQLCLALEELSESDDFHFDWTSEKAMSSINSVFKSATTLAAEYNRQLMASK